MTGTRCLRLTPLCCGWPRSWWPRHRNPTNQSPREGYITTCPGKQHRRLQGVYRRLFQPQRLDGDRGRGTDRGRGAGDPGHASGLDPAVPVSHPPATGGKDPYHENRRSCFFPSVWHTSRRLVCTHTRVWDEETLVYRVHTSGSRSAAHTHRGMHGKCTGGRMARVHRDARDF